MDKLFAKGQDDGPASAALYHPPMYILRIARTSAQVCQPGDGDVAQALQLPSKFVAEVLVFPANITWVLLQGEVQECRKNEEPFNPAGGVGAMWTLWPGSHLMGAMAALESVLGKNAQGSLHQLPGGRAGIVGANVHRVGASMTYPFLLGGRSSFKEPCRFYHILDD